VGRGTDCPGERLKSGFATDPQSPLECKANFRLQPEERFSKAVRAIAGLGNNKGGYLLFGVADGSFQAMDLRTIRSRNRKSRSSTARLGHSGLYGATLATSCIMIARVESAFSRITAPKPRRSLAAIADA
jgi:hypothetical protein